MSWISVVTRLSQAMIPGRIYSQIKIAFMLFMILALRNKTLLSVALDKPEATTTPTQLVSTELCVIWQVNSFSRGNKTLFCQIKSKSKSSRRASVGGVMKCWSLNLL